MTTTSRGRQGVDRHMVITPSIVSKGLAGITSEVDRIMERDSSIVSRGLAGEIVVLDTMDRQKRT